ncbi:hypothetical protein BYT27DRAFT_7206900 [Phlegmacium glaucopus]|nr:hypothetical protein BYT27DRAFT_7206900 [Phlegmacium glaucopus]
MSASLEYTAEFPSNFGAEDWERTLIDFYCSNHAKRDRMKSNTNTSVLVAEIKGPDLSESHYLQIERSARDPDPKKPNSNRGSLRSITTLTSQSSLALSKSLPADDHVKTIETWPSDKCIYGLHCSDASATLLDLAIVAKVVHDNSSQYRLFKRQCFWYSDVIITVLERSFPEMKVQNRSQSVANDHSESAEIAMYDELRGTFKSIPIYTPRNEIINKIQETFEKRKPEVYSLISEAAQAAQAVKQSAKRTEEAERSVLEERKGREEAERSALEERKGREEAEWSALEERKGREEAERSALELEEKNAALMRRIQALEAKALQHLRTLLSIILTKSEVRGLLFDFSVIGADLLSKGAAHLSRRIAPTDEQLRNVDQSAPDDEFITAGGRPTAPGETPVPELSVPSTSKTLQGHPKENEARIVDADGTKEGVGEASQQAQEQYSELKDPAGQIGAEADHKVKDYADTDSPQEAEEKKIGMREKMRQIGHNVRGGISDRIPQQRKDEAHMLAEEYFPAERRDQFIFRGKKVIIECQKRDDYQEAILLVPQSLQAESSFKVAINELQTLLERFANYKSLDIIVDAINAHIDDTRRDKGLREWFESVDVYICKVLLEPGYVLEPACNDQGNRLHETGKHFCDDKYCSHSDNLNHQFGEDWAHLTKDLLFDNEVRYLPIPCTEYTDDSLYLLVENLTLQGRNLFPNIIEMEAHNLIKFSPYDAITDDHNHHMTLRLHQMQADMRDCVLLSDSGLADDLGGEEMVQDVHVKVNTLKFAIRDSKHDFLYKTLRPLATGLIKRQIQKAIKDALITGFEYIDGQLVAVRDRMECPGVLEASSVKDQNLFIFIPLERMRDPRIAPEGTHSEVEKPVEGRPMANAFGSVLIGDSWHGILEMSSKKIDRELLFM